ncbi:anaerobic glycerol-3-phosphate dehydrogenase subunit C [Thermodesulfobacteriota bacterium]
MFKNLEKLIQGDFHTDLLTRYMLSTDGSIFRVEPSAVAYPKNTGDVHKIVAFAKTHGFSIHPRGAGSGLCGSSLGRGIVIDFTRYMNRLISIDLEQKQFECQPGYRLGELEATLNGTGLFFPPDPSSGEYATFGGMYGTNASGAHSVKYGNVADYIMDAEVVLGTGSTITLSEIMSTGFENLPENLKDLYRLYEAHAKTIEASYPDTPYNTAGYNLRGMVRDKRLDLKHLFAGAEGTLGVVTKLKFRLIDKPLHDSLVVAYMPDIVSSGRAVQKILSTGPSGIEIMDKSLLNLAKTEDPDLKDSIPDDIDNVLLIEFDSFDPETCADMAKQTMSFLEEEFVSRVYLAVSADEKARFWSVRKAAVPILYKLKGRKKILALIEDAAVPVRNLTRYFEGVSDLLKRHRVQFVIYGHIAKGLLHTRPLMDLKDPRDIELLRTVADDFYTLIHELDGTVSGEHGDGRLRSAYVRRRYPEIYERFLETKLLMDPENLMNPEIITHHDPDQMKKRLRFGESYRDRDDASPLLSWPLAFPQEIEKCHGCSKCTTVTTATRMCPVYKITREEQASPKAKANILRALISGRIESRTLYESGFQQVIDQCIHCGSCFLECPSHVNIPKMALEARARYVRKYGPSLHNRIIVNVELAGRTTRKLTPLLEPVLALTPIKKVHERIAGISANRDFIAFSEKSLREQIPFRSGHGSKMVVYFAGCYASYIQPSIGVAAVKILSRLKMTVLTPDQHCCGLPMISKGMLPAAVGKIRQNLEKWASLVDDAAAVVVTCSSCGLSLIQEWEDLLGAGIAGKIQQKTIHISRLIAEHQQNLNFKPADLNIAYHFPCHLKIQRDPESSVRMLRGIPGLTVDALQTNCCGMAGSWGLSAAHFRLSKQIGQDMIDKLNVSGATVGVTDCPTCRMQMEQFSSKPIRHPVEIVAGLLI